jgi:hypothetical protein
MMRVYGNFLPQSKLLTVIFPVHGYGHGGGCTVLETWTCPDLSDSQRINGHGRGPFALNRTTVFDDGNYDLLTGAAGNDWFFTGFKDKITNRKNFELVLSI